MELYIARHGETEFNHQRRIQGSGKDSPLTPKGITQAISLGQQLENINFDAVYCSPLGRAVSTIENAFGGKYTPIFDERIVEIGLGVFEGLTWFETREKYPNVSVSYPITNPTAYIPPPEGEGLPCMLKRVNSFLDDILAKHQGQKVFVLTHGFTLCVFYACIIDKDIATIASAPTYGNCQIAKYTHTNGEWRAFA